MVTFISHRASQENGQALVLPKLPQPQLINGDQLQTLLLTTDVLSEVNFRFWSFQGTISGWFKMYIGSK